MLHTAIASDHRSPDTTAPLALAVIIPVMNEAANVRPLLALLDSALGDLAWEAIFVDDNSTDGTADLVRAIGQTNIRVRVLQRIGRRGLASAVIEGMLATSAPTLAVIDGDLQHDERLLPALYRALSDGADLAVASRYLPEGGMGDWSARRQAASRWATRSAKMLTGTAISDPMSGFFMVTREALTAALPRLSGGGFKILLDILASSPRALKVVELPYQFRLRQAGESKLDARTVIDYGLLLIDKTIGRYLPLRLVLFLAIGALGLVPHLVTLGAMLSLGASFDAAQIAAVMVAMTFNFLLNNWLTYRDKRLKGIRFVTGLISFYAVCSVGALANIGVGAWINGAHQLWWVAGIAGALIGASWNFGASSLLTWRR
ncbi:MAG TPA: glycosyltransferase family 2 protein [Sphingomonas sp.]|nr:glycosyltransferase family 2 protein [Sphingomonas sp.]